MQIANVFICRSPSLSIFTRGPFSNRLALGGVLVEIVIVLLIVYTGPGNSLFGTAPVASEVWLFAMPFAAAMLVFEESHKWLMRRHRSQP
jgi:sodium/potassium-transporting ATPase subunit alpha